MASQGPNFGGTITSDGSDGGSSWTAPENAGVDDGATASALTGSSNPTAFLKAQNLGFSIPGTATIDGVEVVVEGYVSATSRPATDYMVRLCNEFGAYMGDNKNLYTWSEVVETPKTYGGPTDTWGVTGISPSVVNDPDFGVGFRVVRGGTTVSMRVDYITVKVYYTDAGGGSGAQVVTIINSLAGA